MAATSASNAWAVGFEGRNTLILHWNGHAWKQVASPSMTGGTLLTGVAASSPANVWAVGDFRNSNSGNTPFQVLALHCC